MTVEVAVDPPRMLNQHFASFPKQVTSNMALLHSVFLAARSLQ